MAGSERVSRYDFAMKIAETFELDKFLTAPVKMKGLTVWIARRPRYSSLSVDKIRRELEVSPLNLNGALKRMFQIQGSQFLPMITGPLTLHPFRIPVPSSTPTFNEASFDGRVTETPAYYVNVSMNGFRLSLPR